MAYRLLRINVRERCAWTRTLTRLTMIDILIRRYLVIASAWRAHWPIGSFLVFFFSSLPVFFLHLFSFSVNTGAVTNADVAAVVAVVSYMSTHVFVNDGEWRWLHPSIHPSDCLLPFKMYLASNRLKWLYTSIIQLIVCIMVSLTLDTLWCAVLCDDTA